MGGKAKYKGKSKGKAKGYTRDWTKGSSKGSKKGAGKGPKKGSWKGSKKASGGSEPRPWELPESDSEEAKDPQERSRGEEALRRRERSADSSSEYEEVEEEQEGPAGGSDPNLAKEEPKQEAEKNPVTAPESYRTGEDSSGSEGIFEEEVDYGDSEEPGRGEAKAPEEPESQEEKVRETSRTEQREASSSGELSRERASREEPKAAKCVFTSSKKRLAYSAPWGGALGSRSRKTVEITQKVCIETESKARPKAAKGLASAAGSSKREAQRKEAVSLKRRTPEPPAKRPPPPPKLGVRGAAKQDRPAEANPARSLPRKENLSGAEAEAEFQAIAKETQGLLEKAERKSCKLEYRERAKQASRLFGVERSNNSFKGKAKRGKRNPATTEFKRQRQKLRDHFEEKRKTAFFRDVGIDEEDL